MEARGGRSANALWFLQCERKLPFLAVSGFSKPGPLPPGRPTWKQVGDARVSSQEQPVLNEAWFKKSDSSLSALPAFLPRLGAEHLKLTCQIRIRLDQRWQAMLQAFRSLSSALLTREEPKTANYRQLGGRAEDEKRWQSRGSSCPPLPAPSCFSPHTSCCSASPLPDRSSLAGFQSTQQNGKSVSNSHVPSNCLRHSPLPPPLPGGLPTPGSRHPNAPAAATCPRQKETRPGGHKAGEVSGELTDHRDTARKPRMTGQTDRSAFGYVHMHAFKRLFRVRDRGNMRGVEKRRPAEAEWGRNRAMLAPSLQADLASVRGGDPTACGAFPSPWAGSSAAWSGGPRAGSSQPVHMGRTTPRAMQSALRGPEFWESDDVDGERAGEEDRSAGELEYRGPRT